MQTMKAAILVGQNQDLVVDEVTLPTELQPGQVKVKVCFSGICGSQLGEIDGAKGPDAFLPHLLGHEGSGIVEETGPGVRHVQPGDRVVLHWRPSRGIEAAPPRYTWRGKAVNAGFVTSFNEVAVVSENRLTPMDPSWDMEQASLFGCAVTTGFGVVENDAKVRMGESVVVYGAGGVGLNMIQAAALRSAYPIVAVDIHDNRLELAMAMGATHRINARDTDVPAAIKAALGPQGADVFIDNTGLPSVIEMAYAGTQPQGRIVLVGVPKKGANVSLYTLPLHFGKSLKGSHGGEATPHLDIPRYARLLQSGRLRLQPLITHRFRLEDINRAIAAMRSGEVTGRCLIDMSAGTGTGG